MNRTRCKFPVEFWKFMRHIGMSQGVPFGEFHDGSNWRFLKSLQMKFLKGCVQIEFFLEAQTSMLIIFICVFYVNLKS